jgi:hypothetical protein
VENSSRDQCAADGRPKKLKLRLTAYLATHSGEAPWAYVELVLCRDVYHCTPSALRREKAREVILHLTCMQIETKVQEAKGG